MQKKEQRSEQIREKTKAKKEGGRAERGGRLRWLWIWLVQIICMAVLAVVAAGSLFISSVLYEIFMWGVLPIAGCASACLSTGKGLLNYAAMLAPPVMQVLGHLLLWGYGPDVPPVCLCGFLSLVGAATGEVIKRQGKQTKENDRWKRI